MKKKTKKNKKHYPAWVLALILAAVLLLEGALSSATSNDWADGFGMLDMSHVTRITYHVTPGLFQPVVEVVTDVNKFYLAASEEMYYLLEGEELFPEVEEVISGIFNFYAQAADEMMTVLDFSEPGRVAGISIEK